MAGAEHEAGEQPMRSRPSPRTAELGGASRLPGWRGGAPIGTPRSRPLLLRVALDDQLHPRLDLEVVLKDIAPVVESEQIVLRCADLDELGHSSCPPLSSV